MVLYIPEEFKCVTHRGLRILLDLTALNSPDHIHHYALPQLFSMPSRCKETICDPEAVRVLHFYQLAPEEDFMKCVHLKATPDGQRCGQQICKDDRGTAAEIYQKIKSLLARGGALQALPNLLLDLAKVTLCNRVHRPSGAEEDMYSKMVTHWSHDLDTEELHLTRAKIEEVKIETVQSEVAPIDDNLSPLTDGNDAIGKLTEIEGAVATQEELEDGKGDPTGQREPVDVTMLDKLEAPLIQEEGTRPTSADSSPCASSVFPVTPPSPLPERVTRSGTFTEAEPEYLPFSPYVLQLSPSQLIQYRNDSLLSLLAKPLSPMAKKHGVVYIFTRPDDPKLVKIGFTTKPGKDRVAQWGRGCCYLAGLEHVTEFMPHAWLVERLAEEELKHHRKREQRCKWNARCSKKHKEWYEIGLQEGIKVVQRWADWIIKYLPWGPDHVMTPEWMSLLNKYRIALKRSDPDEDMWDRWVRMEEPRNVVTMPQPSSTEQNRNDISDTTTPMTESASKSNHPITDADSAQASASKPKPEPTIIATESSNSSNPSSLSPPTTPTHQTIRQTIQTPPDTLRAARAVLSSALSNLDAYISGIDSPLSSPSTKRKATPPRVTLRVGKGSVSLAWELQDEGYCTA